MSEWRDEEDWEPTVEELLTQIYEIVIRIEKRLEALESRQLFERRR